MMNMRNGTTARIPILTYHQIAQAPLKGAAFRSLYVSPGAFFRQMTLLKMLGYRGLSMSGLMPYLRGERKGRVVGITLDDGYLNNLTHALPILNHFGFSATCYVVSKHIGSTNIWDEKLGVLQAPLMDESHLRAWVAGGQEVGAHTRHHVHLPQIDMSASEIEISQCKSELETIVCTPVQHFCYPYGDYLPCHRDMVIAAGFESATTTRRSRSQSSDDMLQLPRIPILRSTTLPLFWAKLATGYEDRRRT